MTPLAHAYLLSINFVLFGSLLRCAAFRLSTSETTGYLSLWRIALCLQMGVASAAIFFWHLAQLILISDYSVRNGKFYIFGTEGVLVDYLSIFCLWLSYGMLAFAAYLWLARNPDKLRRVNIHILLCASVIFSLLRFSLISPPTDSVLNLASYFISLFGSALALSILIASSLLQHRRELEKRFGPNWTEYLDIIYTSTALFGLVSIFSLKTPISNATAADRALLVVPIVVAVSIKLARSMLRAGVPPSLHSRWRKTWKLFFAKKGLHIIGGLNSTEGTQ